MDPAEPRASLPALRVLPIVWLLARAAIISFHSGEDRLVKLAFQQGRRARVYEAGATIAACAQERVNNRVRVPKLSLGTAGTNSVSGSDE